jgi:hypothetical protein
MPRVVLWVNRQILTFLQSRGAQKGQEQGLLRAQEGRSPCPCQGRAGSERGQQDQDPACSVWLLDTFSAAGCCVERWFWDGIVDGFLSANLNGKPTDLFLRPSSLAHEYHLSVTHMMTRGLGSSEFSKVEKNGVDWD